MSTLNDHAPPHADVGGEEAALVVREDVAEVEGAVDAVQAARVAGANAEHAPTAAMPPGAGGADAQGGDHHTLGEEGAPQGDAEPGAEVDEDGEPHGSAEAKVSSSVVKKFAGLFSPIKRKSKKKGGDVEPEGEEAVLPEAPRLTTLPPKSAKEAKKHAKMMAKIDKKYRKKIEKKQRETAKEKQQREKHMSQASSVWLQEILPNWDTARSKQSTRSLWWRGVPPSVREQLWPRAIGNPLQITPQLYNIFRTYAREARDGGTESKLVGKEGSTALLEADLPRTFPHLTFLHGVDGEDGPLREVLETYAHYRPDVGYVQGMSYLAGMLMLYMDEYQAFVSLANLLSNHHFFTFFRMDAAEIRERTSLFQTLLADLLPALSRYMHDNDIVPEMYLMDWMLTLYAKSLPLDVASRVWDVYLLEGESFLFRAALGILKLLSPRLLKYSFEESVATLTHLPSIGEKELFHAIEGVSLSPSKFHNLVAKKEKEKEKEKEKAK